MSRLLLLVLAGIPLLFQVAGTAHASASADTWKHAFVAVPFSLSSPATAGAANLDRQSCTGRMSQRGVMNCLERVGQSLLAQDKRLPVVLFAHGCNGLRPEVDGLKRWRDAGHIVIAPDSMHHAGRPPVMCGMFRGAQLDENWRILSARFADMRYAAAKLKDLPWVGEIVLAGFSEGGNVSRLMPDSLFSGRIILGATCVGGDSRYHGLRAPAREPALAIVGTEDHILKTTARRYPGDCESWMQGRPNSAAVNIEGAEHNILVHPSTLRAVDRFVHSVVNNTPLSAYREPIAPPRAEQSLPDG